MSKSRCEEGSKGAVIKAKITKADREDAEAALRQDEEYKQAQIIAEKLRSITEKIFADTNFRMPKIKVDEPYWAFGVIINNRIEWSESALSSDGKGNLSSDGKGNFSGIAQTMRVNLDGRMRTVEQSVPRCYSYNLNQGEFAGESRPSTNKEIAFHATEMASALLEALGKRIDGMKDEKRLLQQMAQVSATPAPNGDL